MLERQLTKGLSLQYRYGLFSGMKVVEWEKDPRQLRIFTGHQAAMFGTSDDTMFSNSRVLRIDGNFLKSFNPSAIDLNHGKAGGIQSQYRGKIYVSSMPQEKEDLEEIKRLGITSVLDLTGAVDQPESVRKMILTGYSKVGIQHVNYPVDIGTDQDFAITTFTGAQYLAELLESNDSVLVHCKSGIVRAPTLVLTYLCMYKRTKHWQSVPRAADSLQAKLYGAEFPNRNLVTRIVNDN